MNGHLKKAYAALVLLMLTGACAGPSNSGEFSHADYSGGSSLYGVYVPSQGRSIMSSLSF